MNSLVAESRVGTITSYNSQDEKYSISLDVPVDDQFEDSLPANTDFPKLFSGDRLEIIVISHIEEQNGRRIIIPVSMYGARFAARQVDQTRVYYNGCDKFPGDGCEPHLVAAKAMLNR